MSTLLVAARSLALLAAALVAGAIGTSRTATAQPVQVERGKGEFTFADARGDPSRPIRVFSYVPPNVDPRTAPIVFVMHGHSRSANGYRNDWAQHADHYGFMVFAPLFDTDNWGHGLYSYASVADRHGRVRDPSQWSFSVVEHLFDAIKSATGNLRPRYSIFGFSEGGQFVHRLVLLMPNARYDRAVAGSPGWYTMPRLDVRFPYGLSGAPANAASLATSLGRDFVLLLGDQDNDPNHGELRKTPEAMAQGANRFDRGRLFYAEGQRRAQEMRTGFGWRILAVPGADHTSRKVSGTAAAILMQR